MRIFLIKIGIYLLSLITLWAVILAVYLINDPFKIIRDYSDYSYSNVSLNRDFVSTEMFIKNHKKYGYNSYIFGSSRTLAFKPLEWKEFLPEDGNPFMFDASGESVYGIYTKLKFLDSINARIDNALIIICTDVTFETDKNYNSYLFIKHPRVSGESSMEFHKIFFSAYLNPMFLISYYDFKFTKSVKTYMSDYIDFRKIKYDTVTNELRIIDQEEEIENNPNDYYAKRKQLFYDRPDTEFTDSTERINERQLMMLTEINRILKKNKTNFKVVISPLYSQVKINSKDFQKLQKIFSSNLFNYSGKNNYTDSVTNYFETSHYRPIVGKSIMQEIYK